MSKSHALKKKAPKRVLALPDLEQAKSAVVNSLSSTSGQRTYDHAITEFVSCIFPEPRLAFNRTVVLRYRIHLEQQHYAPTRLTSAWPPSAASPMRPPNRVAQSRVGGRDSPG